MPEAQVEHRDALFEQLHAGLFAADPAVKKIGDAVDIARELEAKVTPDLVAGTKAMAEVLDHSGAALAEKTGEDPPSEDAVKKDPAKYKQKRDQLIATLKVVLHDIRDQEGIAAAFALNAAPDIKKLGASLDEALTGVIDDLEGALASLGAPLDGAQERPDTGDPGQKPPAGYTG